MGFEPHSVQSETTVIPTTPTRLSTKQRESVSFKPLKVMPHIQRLDSRLTIGSTQLIAWSSGRVSDC